jgi:hypothetical protein
VASAAQTVGIITSTTAMTKNDQKPAGPGADCVGGSGDLLGHAGTVQLRGVLYPVFDPDPHGSPALYNVCLKHQNDYREMEGLGLVRGFCRGRLHLCRSDSPNMASSPLKPEEMSGRNYTRLFLSSLLAALAVVAGCSRNGFQSAHGDIGNFILQEAFVRGVRPKTANNLPSLTGEWSYERDKYDVVIRLAPDKYPAVEAFLASAFGKPQSKSAKAAYFQNLIEYRSTPNGGAIQAMSDTNYTQVIIFHG